MGTVTQRSQGKGHRLDGQRRFEWDCVLQGEGSGRLKVPRRWKGMGSVEEIARLCIER